MAQRDIVIAGAGLIGLSCALELQSLGMRVTVLDQGAATRQASWAAAGMLAAHDPQNPAQLRDLGELSISLYPAFLERVAELSGTVVPLETEWTLEAADGAHPTQTDLPQLRGDGFRRIAEQSLDPRRLAAAVLAAARAVGIQVQEHTEALRWGTKSNGVTIETACRTIRADYLLDCTGAWSRSGARPAKGQMLRVKAHGVLTSAALGNVVVRTPQIYMVPRLDGSVVIGATVEDAGFDTATHDDDLNVLRARAGALLPVLASAPELERWAGLRPDTPDHLPVLGQNGERCYVATGHYRNGILLAPATARVLGQVIAGRRPCVNLGDFAPDRFL